MGLGDCHKSKEISDSYKKGDPTSVNDLFLTLEFAGKPLELITVLRLRVLRNRFNEN